MTNGNSTLSLSDLPFWYSFINIVYIWTTGNTSLEDLGSKFLVVGLIAGFIGTFFVFWHPLQWIIEKLTWKTRKNYSTYHVEAAGNQVPFHDIHISDEYLRLSLKTSIIGYYKNKMVSQFYFLAILITISLALLDPNFQSTTTLKNSVFLLPIQIIILCMMGGLFYFIHSMKKYFLENVRLHAMYYLVAENLENYQNVTHLKQAIDLHDWTTVKNATYRILGRHWEDLARFKKPT